MPLEIDIDHIGPDQIIGTQHVEGRGHARAFEIAALDHLVLDGFDLLLVGKDFEITRIGEIDLSGEQGRAGNAFITHCRHIGERDRQQGAADAIADGGDFFLAANLLDLVERGQHAFLHIIGKALFGLPLVGIDPGDHEYGQPL